MKFTCGGQGEAIGATDWEFLKTGTSTPVKAKSKDKAMSLKYGVGDFGSGVYTCVAHRGTDDSATSNAIELKDDSSGTS